MVFQYINICQALRKMLKTSVWAMPSVFNISLRIRPQGYKTFFMLNSTEHAQFNSIKFIRLLNDKMPTVVGILTFISVKNTASETLRARNYFICQHLAFTSS